MTTAWYRPEAQPVGRQFAASKVPEVTVYFWIIKILSIAGARYSPIVLADRRQSMVGIIASGLTRYA